MCNELSFPHALVDERRRLSFDLVALEAAGLQSTFRVGRREVFEVVRRVLHRLHVNAVLVAFEGAEYEEQNRNLTSEKRLHEEEFNHGHDERNDSRLN